MRKFITELIDKDVITNDGLLLGKIDDFVIDSTSGALVYVLLTVEERGTEMFKTDDKGRIILPFHGIQSVGDVVVMNTE